MNNTPNPDPYVAWQVVLTLGVIVAIVTNIWTAARSNRTQKREVSFELNATPREEFDRLVDSNSQEHRDIHSKIGGMDRGFSRKIADEMSAIHNRVNGLEKAIGGLETSAEITNQRLAQIDSKVDRLIERT